MAILSSTIEDYLSDSEISTRLLLEIRLSNATYRFIVDDAVESQTIKGIEWLGANISLGSRDESTDTTINSLSITLSNKYQEWAAIMANRGKDFLGAYAILYYWFPDYPNEEPIAMLEGVIDDLKMSANSFELRLNRVLGDYDQQSPNMTFDPNCQYSFKDARCKYSGTAYTTCGKTMTECKARGNISNFGGHPSVPRELVIKS